MITDLLLRDPSYMRPYEALHPDHLSVRMSVPIYSKPESRRKVTFRGDMTMDMSKWESKLEIRRSLGTKM